MLGFVAAVAAVATTYCMRRVPPREMKPASPVSEYLREEDRATPARRTT